MKEISVEHILLSGLFIFLIAIAGTVDYHRVVNYLFGDEAVYYMMAQSFAGDLDLEYSRKDLMRVYESGWHAGPQGVFLTRLENGKIYYAKSFAYSLLLAPFLTLFGMNGFLILNMLMLFLMILMGWLYLKQFNPSLLSLLVSMTFFLLSASFIYSFWLTPEIFNMFCITLGLFLWLYQREQRHVPSDLTLRSPAPVRWLLRLLLTPQGRLYLAPIPIAVAGASKLPNILFAFPILADLLWETFQQLRKSVPSASAGRALFRYWPKLRKFVWAGLIFTAAVLLFYGLQYLFIGHFNQYAGDRKSFYWEFPLESGKDVWEQGVRSSNDDYFEQAFYYRSKVLLHNIHYYLLGRFTGMLPYFCCSFLALYYFLRARRIRCSITPSREAAILPGEQARRIFLLLTIVASILAYIVLAPSNYQGGGGAFGNRFFINIYPGFFFLMTSLSGIVPLMISWLVGSFFLAQVLINPFHYSSYPAMQAFRFPYRLLPVELTLLNTLPTTLSRSLVQGETPDRNPTHKLYFFDENAADRSPNEFWVRGRSRADLAIRAFDPGDFLSITLINGPIANRVDVTVGGMTQTVRFEREREKRRLVFPLRNPVPFFRSSVYPMSIRSQEGFVPKFIAGTGLNDSRFLGCRIELSLDAFEIGKTLFEQKRFEEALLEFENALEQRPQHIYVHYYRGRAYQALGRTDEALRSFDEAKTLLPGFQSFFHIDCRQNNERCPFIEAASKAPSPNGEAELAELLAPLSLQFEAEELSRNTGHVVPDSQASGGEIVEFRAQKDTPGFLAYGRHINLPAGEYQLRYRAKVAPADDKSAQFPQIAFWYDVYGIKKQGVLQKELVSLTASQLCKPEGFQDYVLNFELAHPANIEFRVESSGNADIALDRIELYPRLPLQIQQAVAEVKQSFGLLDEAGNIFEKLLEIDSSSPKLLSDYLETLFMQQRWDKAQDFIREKVKCSEFRSGVLGKLLLERDLSALPPDFQRLQEQLLASFTPEIPVERNFGQLIELLGYSLSSDERMPGKSFHMELFWKALAEIPVDYAVSVEFVRKGTISPPAAWLKLTRKLGLPALNRSQHQRQPLHGSSPTSQWLPGELLRESYELQLPADLRAGGYEIKLSLVNPLTKQRLGTIGEERMTIGEIEVKDGAGMD